MKVAILIPGQPRSIKSGYETLKKFYLDKYECDIFIHTWFDKKFPASIYGEMIELYQPKKIIIEEQIIFDKYGRQDPKWKYPLQSILSQYYSVYMVNQLKSLYEESQLFKYDFVIRSRSDIKMTQPIECEKIEIGKIALHEWTQHNFDYMGLSDVFAIGTSELMDIYCDLYPHIMYYVDEDPTYSINGPKMGCEYLLKHHLETVNKIQIQKFYHKDQTDRTWDLARE